MILKTPYFLFVTSIVFLGVTSCNDVQADINSENLKKVAKGMRMEEVIEIMGKPDTIFLEPLNAKAYWYLYRSPSLMSDHFYIYISRKNSVVIGINDGR